MRKNLLSYSYLKNHIYKYLISYCLGYFRVNAYRNTLKTHMHTFFKSFDQFVYDCKLLEANDLKILFIWNVVKMHNSSSIHYILMDYEYLCLLNWLTIVIHLVLDLWMFDLWKVQGLGAFFKFFLNPINWGLWMCEWNNLQGLRIN